MKTLFTEDQRRALREAKKVTLATVDTGDLDDAVVWVARALKKVRLWTTLIQKHTGISVQRRHWREATAGQDRHDYWDWVGSYLSDQTEDYGPAETRAIAKDFVKKAGLAKGRSIDEAIAALMHGWSLTRPSKMHLYAD